MESGAPCDSGLWKSSAVSMVGRWYGRSSIYSSSFAWSLGTWSLPLLNIFGIVARTKNQD